MVSDIRGIAIYDKRGRASSTYVGYANCHRLAGDSDLIFEEGNHCRCYGFVLCTGCCTPVAQTLVVRGPGAVQTSADAVKYVILSQRTEVSVLHR